MFYLSYLRRELTRRLGRTLLTVLGLGVGVALVVVISALSTGLDRAQKGVLDPLQQVGTDLVVSRPVAVPTAGPQAGSGSNSSAAGAALLGGVPPDEVNALVDENQSLFETDLSKFGAPGSTFERELFLPATQLTFPTSEAARITKLRGVRDVAGGLTLLAIHQKGKVPEIVAEFQTGGETFNVEQKIAPPSQAEWDSIASCIQRTRGGPNCLPARFAAIRTAFTTPREIIKQVLNPPQTDLATEPYTAAGVDTKHPGVGLITKAQIREGKYFGEDLTTKQAVLAVGYARRKHISVGGTVTLNGTQYTVVGLAEPPLGGQSADIYLRIGDLQQLAGRADRVNVLLVRVDKAANVARVTRAIERAFPGSQVTSARELAKGITGSLVSAGNLAHRLGLALAGIALFGAIAIAVLMTTASVSKRVRELGTLAALGWKRGLVIRQVIGESLVQGTLGGIVGAALGVAGAAAITAAAPRLEASATQGAGPLAASFGLGRVLADQANHAVRLSAPTRPAVVAGAAAVAVIGGFVAGAAGALRAARLRPADALRSLE